MNGKILAAVMLAVFGGAVQAAELPDLAGVRASDIKEMGISAPIAAAPEAAGPKSLRRENSLTALFKFWLEHDKSGWSDPMDKELNTKALLKSVAASRSASELASVRAMLSDSMAEQLDGAKLYKSNAEIYRRLIEDNCASVREAHPELAGKTDAELIQLAEAGAGGGYMQLIKTANPRMASFLSLEKSCEEKAAASKDLRDKVDARLEAVLG